MKRDYKKEYNSYHKKPEQRARRSSRNKARRLAIKKHGAAAVQGKDVDHRDRNPHNNSTSNLRIQSKNENRGRNK
jgi:hypothetical protein